MTTFRVLICAGFFAIAASPGFAQFDDDAKEAKQSDQRDSEDYFKELAAAARKQGG